MQTTVNPIDEMYERRPRRWWLYTLILLCVAAVLGWSGNAIEYKGLASKGSEVCSRMAKNSAALFSK